MAKNKGYQIAEQRIEEARQAGDTGLDLLGLQLREVPESITALTQLKYLYLALNKLSEVPESITALTQLQELDLSDNK